MALTVRPDDEVYQFDTVWLGPDEYTLPIQARYVAWGTWLACFLVAAVVLIPLGGGGPAGVLGSLIWSLGLSVVLSRAVMLVVDHERPLRSLPALFSAEARAALAARRRGERSLLVRPGKIRVRETPPKVLAMRERQKARAAAKADRKKADRKKVVPSTELAVVEPVVEPVESAWTPDLPVDEWYAEPTPAWSVAVDDREDYPVAPVPAWGMPAGEHERYVAPAPVEPEVHEFVRAPDPEPQRTQPATPTPVAANAAASAPSPVAAKAAVQGWTGAGAWPAPQARAAAAAKAEAAHSTEPAPAHAHAAHAQAAKGRPAVQEARPAHGAGPADAQAAPGRPAAQAAQGRPAAQDAQARPAAQDARPAHGARPAQGPGQGEGGGGASPFRADPQEAEPQGEAYRGPVTVSPESGRHAKPAKPGRDADAHAALEARILLPARKDR